MNAKRRRNIKLVRCAEVKAGSFHDQQITITTGSWNEREEVVAVASLSLHCARKLILDLRRALRDTTVDIVRYAEHVNDEAQGPI